MLGFILAAVACFAVGTQTASFRAPVHRVTSFVADVDRAAFHVQGIQEPMRAGTSRAHRANPVAASTQSRKDGFRKSQYIDYMSFDRTMPTSCTSSISASGTRPRSFAA